MIWEMRGSQERVDAKHFVAFLASSASTLL
jgi:hypothetical protein